MKAAGSPLGLGAPPACVLVHVNSTRYEFPPVKQALNPIRKQSVNPKTFMPYSQLVEEQRVVHTVSPSTRGAEAEAG